VKGKKDGNTEFAEGRTQRAQRKEKKKITQRRRGRRGSQRREEGAEESDGKSPSFAENHEGWGTLKFKCWMALEGALFEMGQWKASPLKG